MTRKAIMDSILLGLVLICVLGGLFTAFSFWDLVHRAEALRAQVDGLNAELTSSAAVRAVTQMTLTDVTAMIKQDDSDLKNVCRYSERLKTLDVRKLSDTDQTGYLNSVYNICPDTPGSNAPATREFFLIYLKAAAARLDENFPAAAGFYQDAQNVKGFDELQADWKVRALEGHAYAMMRMNNIAQAKLDLAKAAEPTKTMPSGFVFSETTAIKIMCLEKAKPEDVQQAMTAVRARLDGLIADPKASADTHFYAKLDRDFVDKDTELFRLCQNAGIAPAPSTGPAKG